MTIRAAIVAVAGLSTIATSAVAYEILTHEQLSTVAAQASSMILDVRILANLGLRRATAPDQTFPNSRGKAGDLLTLIRDGARFEDDILRAPYLVSRHHFFDPIDDTGLCSPPGCEASPDWALEDRGPIATQAFSFGDARRYLEHALTDQDEVERQRNWGLVFESLGHVIHHLQDMAQPQHVRDETHILAARYERYVASQPLPTGALEYPNLSLPGSSIPRSLWQTRTACDTGASPVCWGMGIAEFTNYNFVTESRNFRGAIDIGPDGLPLPGPLNSLFPDSRYPRPNSEGATVEVMDWPVPFPPDFPDEVTALVGKLYFVRTPVRDAVTSEPGVTIRAATYSLFDQDLADFDVSLTSELVGVGCRATFNLNHLNFEDARLQLLRRARAYSTALLDYFFRTLIDFRPDATQPDHYVIENLSEDVLVGRFRVFYDTDTGERIATNTIYDTGPAGIPPGGSVSVAFVLGLDVPADAVGYILVFKGSAGAEPGPTGSDVPGVVGDRSGTIAAKRKAIRAPVLVNPAGRFTYGQQGWKFAHDAGRQYGDLNWFGVDGALSWVGQPSRNWFGSEERLIGELSPVVWEAGEAKYHAPGPVLGAALTTDSPTGRPYVIVITAVTRPSVPFNDCTFPLVATGEKAYRAALDQPSITWEPGPDLDYVGDDSCSSALEAFNLQETDFPAPYFFNSQGTEAVSLKGCPGCSSGVRLVTFTWPSGFTLHPLENPDHCDPDYATTMAADYQGDQLVTAVYRRNIVCDSSPSIVDQERLVFGAFEFPFFDTSAGVFRDIQYIDLRTTQPTIVYADMNAQSTTFRPAWIVDGVSELLGDWVSSDGFPGGLAATVAVDPQGHAAVDWNAFHLSRLFPSADAKVLAGRRGPVGLM